MLKTRAVAENGKRAGQREALGRSRIAKSQCQRDAARRDAAARPLRRGARAARALECKLAQELGEVERIAAVTAAQVSTKAGSGCSPRRV